MIYLLSSFSFQSPCLKCPLAMQSSRQQCKTSFLSLSTHSSSLCLFLSQLNGLILVSCSCPICRATTSDRLLGLRVFLPQLTVSPKSLSLHSMGYRDWNQPTSPCHFMLRSEHCSLPFWAERLAFLCPFEISNEWHSCGLEGCRRHLLQPFPGVWQRQPSKCW